MIRLLSASLLAAAVGLTGVAGAAAPAQAATTPGKITAVTAKPGPGVGEVTITWEQSGTAATAFEVETGLTSFSPSPTSSLPTHGRSWKIFRAAGTARSLTLSADQVAAAGAPVGSANHLYFRLRAVRGTVQRWYPYLQTVGVKPAVPNAGTPLRVATFNVRTVHAKDDPRTWLQRVPDVARQIVKFNPGVVLLQELTPGRADGVSGSTKGLPRQTDSLQSTLKTVGGAKYALTRTTPYVKPGLDTNTQGTRVLYDTTRFDLLSNCTDKTATSSYSTSCSISLPIRAEDTGKDRRVAAYAELRERATGKRFFVVSAHLDARHSSTLSVEKTLDKLRADQARHIMRTIAQLNTAKLPVFFGGDLNAWQNNKVGYSAHDALVADGYYDTAAATKQVDITYSTMNSFATVMEPGTNGFGSRLDAILVKGVRGAVRWENVMARTDANRPSDHNMVVADVRLP